MEVVLVETSEEKDFVFLDGTADGASDLLLAVVRLEGEEGIGGAEGAVAEEVESGAVPVIRSRLGDDVDDRSARAPEFSAIGVGRDSEFLHDFGRKLVGSAVASASLGEECVIEV